MSKRHLAYFKVENFKRFDSLELTDIGQFNLIVGDNNVGKTSVLEALLFDGNRKKCLLNFHKILSNKGLNIAPIITYGSKGEVVDVRYPDENFLRYIFKALDAELLFVFRINDPETLSGHLAIKMTTDHYPSLEDERFPGDDEPTFTGKSPDNRYISFYDYSAYDSPYVYDEEFGHEYGGPGENKHTVIAGLYEHLSGQNLTSYEISLISTSLNSSQKLSDAYYEQVGLSRSKKKELTESLQFLLPKIEDFEVRKINGSDHLLIGLSGQDELMPISVFGESVTRAAQILLEIAKYKGGRLMIDEIDTGIHYSRMKHFLKTIFQVAEKNEVQLFMTTHSLECQQAFAEVFEEANMVEWQGKARQFSLLETEKGNVVANGYNFDQLKNALDIGFETRGGKDGW
jgi:AAA15 family ATPase/GTPase